MLTKKDKSICIIVTLYCKRTIVFGRAEKERIAIDTQLAIPPMGQC